MQHAVLIRAYLVTFSKEETANWSLRQGDEEVNKRIKQKVYIQTNCPIFRFENKPSTGAKEKGK